MIDDLLKLDRTPAGANPIPGYYRNFGNALLRARSSPPESRR